MIIQKLWCKLFGHNWMFPHAIMLAGKRRIEAKDYWCGRCDARRDKLFMDELLEKENTKCPEK